MIENTSKSKKHKFLFLLIYKDSTKDESHYLIFTNAELSIRIILKYYDKSCLNSLNSILWRIVIDFLLNKKITKTFS